MSTYKPDDYSQTKTSQDQYSKDTNTLPQQASQKLCLKSQNLFKRMVIFLKNNKSKIIILLILIWAIALQVQVVFALQLNNQKLVTSVLDDLPKIQVYGPYFQYYWDCRFNPQYQWMAALPQFVRIDIQKKSIVSLKANGRIFLKNSNFIMTFLKDKQLLWQTTSYNVPYNSFQPYQQNIWVPFQLDQEAVVEPGSSQLFEIAFFPINSDVDLIDFSLSGLGFTVKVQEWQE